MYYILKFESKDNMWDFIDAHIKSNYSADNPNHSVKLNEKDHPMQPMISKAQKAKGFLTAYKIK